MGRISIGPGVGKGGISNVGLIDSKMSLEAFEEKSDIIKTILRSGTTGSGTKNFKEMKIWWQEDVFF